MRWLVAYYPQGVSGLSLLLHELLGGLRIHCPAIERFEGVLGHVRRSGAPCCFGRCVRILCEERGCALNIPLLRVAARKPFYCGFPYPTHLQPWRVSGEVSIRQGTSGHSSKVQGIEPLDMGWVWRTSREQGGLVWVVLRNVTHGSLQKHPSQQVLVKPSPRVKTGSER